jgi:DNA-binding MarR family transcriptional regulator
MDDLRRIVRGLRLSARAAERQFGLSSAQLFVLQRLAEARAPSLAELAERTLTDQSSVSVVVARLEERGLVARTRSTSDARRFELALSAAGHALLRQAPEPAQARLVAGLTSLRPAELRAVANALGLLSRLMGVSDEAPGLFFEEPAPPARSRRAGPADDHPRTNLSSPNRSRKDLSSPNHQHTNHPSTNHRRTK